MKLHVMYDQSGRIVAAVRIDEHVAKTKHGQPGQKVGTLRPIVKRGHSTADIDVPAEHANLGFAEACRQLEVDVGHATPRLRLRARS